MPITEKPPSRGMPWPVTKSDAGLARKMAMPRISSGFPQRPAGVRCRMVGPISGCSYTGLVSSVLSQPGTMQLTWMLYLAQATARLLVSWTVPPGPGVWLANVLFFGTALVLLWRADHSSLEIGSVREVWAWIRRRFERHK